jgi:hypothetical protein
MMVTMVAMVATMAAMVHVISMGLCGLHIEPHQRCVSRMQCLRLGKKLVVVCACGGRAGRAAPRGMRVGQESETGRGVY